MAPHEAKEVPTKVVIVHAQKDRLHATELTKHLKPYCDQGILQVWHHGMIVPGEDCRIESKRIDEADMIFMMISPDFQACADLDELQRKAMERSKRGQTTIIPVKLRSTVPEGSLLAGLAPLPRYTKPIISRRDRDQAWIEVAEGVRAAAYELRSRRFQQPTTTAPPTKGDSTAISSLIEAGERFTMDLGHAKGFFFRPGPLVLTYLQPKATVCVSSGPPWMAEEDAPTVVSLRGESFRGEFFVENGWCIYGLTKTCICSGFYPYGGLPLPDGACPLTEGAIFYHSYGKSWTLWVPDGPNLESRQQAALQETERLVKVRLECSSWRKIKEKDGLVMMIAHVEATS